MKFPIMVNNISMKGGNPFEEKSLSGDVCGTLVSVRPCDEKFNNKTFLGIYLGELPLSVLISLDEKTAELSVERSMYNPMIFIPSEKTIIMGYESFWHKIENEDELREITNDDINNVWYIKAIREKSESNEIL